MKWVLVLVVHRIHSELLNDGKKNIYSPPPITLVTIITYPTTSPTTI
jgi:hypothetical protein